MIPLQWLYAVLPTWRLHVMSFLLLFHTLVNAIVMLPSVAPWFSFLSWKFWSLAALDNTWSSFFLPSRSSILNLVYLYYFRSSIYDFWSCSSPLSRLSNATVLTQFGFFNRDLYPISHNALIMDCFSRAHLYDMPCVNISSFVSKLDKEKITDCAISATFYEIPIRYSQRFMMNLPRSFLWDEF